MKNSTRPIDNDSIAMPTRLKTFLVNTNDGAIVDATPDLPDAVPGAGARYVPDFADVPAVVAALAEPGDLVLTMGAGDITKMGPLVLDEIAASGATTP